MIEDLSFPLDGQNQKNLTEWAVKCAMCNDTVDPHERFFTDAECHAFRTHRMIPDQTLAWVARFTGRSLDSAGVDLALVEPTSGQRLVRGHIYTVMVGHVVVQILSWHPEPAQKGKIVWFRPVDGPWDRLTTQIWPLEKGTKAIEWPPELSLSTSNNLTHYGHFRTRFKNESGHRLITPKPKISRK